MRVLADTSVWVEFFRRPDGSTGQALDRLLERREVLMCGPVAAELLAGTVPAQQGELWAVLSALPWAELERDTWRSAGEIAWRLRRDGTAVGLADVSIAAAALAADAMVWTTDADFARISATTDCPLFQP